MKGAAADVLNSFPTTASNYEPAVATLMKRFGKNQIIVRNHLEDLLKGQKIDNDPKQLRLLIDKIAAKKAILDHHEVTWDQLFVQIVENQLSRPLKEKWIRKICPLIENDEVADSCKLLEFLHTELAAMEVLDSSKGSLKKVKTAPFEKRFLKKEWPASAQALVSQSSTPTCLFCPGSHELTRCDKFLDWSPSQRLTELVGQPGKVCFKCLKSKGASGHPATFRKCTAKCGISGCHKAHHTLLHVDEAKPESKVNAIVSVAHCLSHVPAHLNHEPKFADKDIQTILPTALAKIKVNGKEKIVRVGFDSFSQKTFVTKNIVTQLSIPVTNTEVLNIGGFGGTSTIETMDVVKFVLTPVFDNTREKVHIEAHVKSGPICSPLDPLELKLDSVPHLQNLTLADPVPRQEAEIDLLIGSRYYFQLLNGRVIGPRVAETGPLAIESPFGWVFAGPLLKNTLAGKRTTSEKCMLLTVADLTKPRGGNLELQKLDGQLRKFWEQEAIGLVDSDVVFTQDERSAVSQFDNSVQFDGERYHVALSFRDKAPELSSNYYEAKMRLCATEKSLKKNPEKLKAYDAAIMDYVENGFAHELNAQELFDVRDGSKYFIPHHPVFKDSSTST